MLEENWTKFAPMISQIVDGGESANTGTTRVGLCRLLVVRLEVSSERQTIGEQARTDATLILTIGGAQTRVQTEVLLHTL